MTTFMSVCIAFIYGCARVFVCGVFVRVCVCKCVFLSVGACVCVVCSGRLCVMPEGASVYYGLG